jgi:hypothetical protein
MKRILIISAVLAVSAAVYYFLIRSPGGEMPATPNAPAVAASDSGAAAATTSNQLPKRPIVEPYVERPLVPPPSAPPANWVQPNFAVPTAKLIQHPPTGKAPGLAAVARVELNGETHEVHPNQVGHFERLSVGRKTKVPFTVGYPAGSAGEVVIAVAEDGGALGKGTVVAKVPLDVDLKAAFEFETADRDGLFRVTVKKGADVKALEFWSGPPPGYAGTAR